MIIGMTRLQLTPRLRRRRRRRRQEEKKRSINSAWSTERKGKEEEEEEKSELPPSPFTSEPSKVMAFSTFTLKKKVGMISFANMLRDIAFPPCV